MYHRREVATFLADLLLQRYPQLLKARYGFNTDGMDGVAVVEGVAAKRGFRLKGGEYDFEKAAHTFLQDYRSGALGRISLETPQSRAELLATYRSTDNPDALPAEDEEEDDEDYDWRTRRTGALTRLSKFCFPENLETGLQN
jgi:ribosome biogenesis GTPase A